MSKKRILYFDFHNGASEFYRTLPLSYINNPDLQITRSTETNINFATLSGVDVIIVCRPSSGASLALIKLAKDMHIRVISDFDDDVIHLPNTNPMWEVYEQEKRNVLECVALSDEVWVSTDGVRNNFRLFNRNIVVMPNAHDDYLFRIEDKRTFTYNKLAVWRGGHSHEADMYAGDTPERVIEMVNSNPDWEFRMIGQRFTYLESRCGSNYIAQGGASTVQFYKMLHDLNPCIMWYPLEDNLFNRGKSNICWIEATYSGAAFFGNMDLPEFKKGGLSRFSTMPEWLGVPDLLDSMNRISWEYILDNLLVSTVNQIRIERLLNI